MQMLGSRQGMGGGEREGAAAGGERPAGAAKPAPSKGGGKFDDFEDDIPF
jgi:single-stranded DNA-binding protein